MYRQMRGSLTWSQEVYHTAPQCLLISTEAMVDGHEEKAANNQELCHSCQAGMLQLQVRRSVQVSTTSVKLVAKASSRSLEALCSVTSGAHSYEGSVI